MDCCQKPANTTRQKCFLLRFQILRRLQRVVHGCIRIRDLGRSISCLLLLQNFVLDKVLKTVVEDLTDLKTILCQLLDDIIVEVALLKAVNAGKHALLQLQKSNLFSRLDLAQDLLPEMFERKDKSGVSSCHCAINIWKLLTGGLEADAQNLTKHVPVQSEHIR